jgi:hypothetical protein
MVVVMEPIVLVVVKVGTGTSIITVPVCPGAPVTVVVVTTDPVYVEVTVVVGTGISMITVPVCPGVAVMVVVVIVEPV